MTRPRLLALDLDGTLLRRDHSISPRDESAIRAAVRDGVHVAICTGRVSTGAIGAARKLDLQTTMICADGGVHACPNTAQKRWQQPIQLAAAEHVATLADEHDMPSFVFLHHEIHADARGERWLDYIRTWTPDVFVHDRLVSVDHWRSHEDVAVVLTIGPREHIERTAAVLREERAHELTIASWRAGSSGDHHALLTRPVGVDKGTGLASLAAQLGVAREDVCAVGDWYNDVPMFQWAGRSFVMGQSLDDVKRHATDRLEATSDEGGGVAEAIDRWLR